MKKVLFLFITAACLFQINALAQKAQVGLASGVSVSNVYGRAGGLDTRGEARLGFTGGLLVDAPLGKSNISFQPGIHYVQKGGYTTKTEILKEADALRYADLVLNFIHHIGNKNKTRLFLGLGPQIGFELPSKKIKIENDERTEVRNIAFGKGILDDFRGLDYGANFLMGLRFKNGMFFAVNYTLGLRNQDPVSV